MKENTGLRRCNAALVAVRSDFVNVRWLRSDFGCFPFGRLWHAQPNAISNAIGYAKFFSRSHDAVIRVYNEAGNVIETHEHKGDFKEP